MSTADLAIEAAQRLTRSGTPFALVSVIRALAPASARPGDKAVVTADGQMHGWIGGGCAQPAVVRTVRQVLADGRARVIRITPSQNAEEKDLGDVLEFGMSCHSGGTLELFVDPVLPHAELVVIGASPVARSLVQLAPKVGFVVTWVAHGNEDFAHADGQRVIGGDDVATAVPQIAPGGWVVVATQGRRDIQGLRLALALQARQVSFVASTTKAQVLKRSLIEAGSDAAAVEAIVAPAGYPMAATTPEEIALSVLAAVVSHRRGGRAGPAGPFCDAPQLAAGAAVAAAPMAPVEAVAVLPATSCCGAGAAVVAAERAAVPAATAAPPPSCCTG